MRWLKWLFPVFFVADVHPAPSQSALQVGGESSFRGAALLDLATAARWNEPEGDVRLVKTSGNVRGEWYGSVGPINPAARLEVSWDASLAWDSDSRRYETIVRQSAVGVAGTLSWSLGWRADPYLELSISQPILARHVSAGGERRLIERFGDPRETGATIGAAWRLQEEHVMLQIRSGIAFTLAVAAEATAMIDDPETAAVETVSDSRSARCDCEFEVRFDSLTRWRSEAVIDANLGLKSSWQMNSSHMIELAISRPLVLRCVLDVLRPANPESPLQIGLNLKLTWRPEV